LRYRLGSAPTGAPMAVSEGDPLLVQRVRRPDGSVLVNVFNSGDTATERLIGWDLAGARGAVTEGGAAMDADGGGILVNLRPHQSRLFRIAP